MYIKLLIHSRCSVIGLSFHLLMFYIVINLQLGAKASISISNVHSISDLGEPHVLKIHFILNKEALVRKIRKEVGIHQRQSGCYPLG